MTLDITIFFVEVQIKSPSDDVEVSSSKRVPFKGKYNSVDRQVKSEGFTIAFQYFVGNTRNDGLLIP